MDTRRESIGGTRKRRRERAGRWKGRKTDFNSPNMILIPVFPPVPTSMTVPTASCIPTRPRPRCACIIAFGHRVTLLCNLTFPAVSLRVFCKILSSSYTLKNLSHKKYNKKEGDIKTHIWYVRSEKSKEEEASQHRHLRDRDLPYEISNEYITSFYIPPLAASFRLV